MNLGSEALWIRHLSSLLSARYTTPVNGRHTDGRIWTPSWKDGLTSVVQSHTGLDRHRTVSCLVNQSINQSLL